MKLAHSLAPGAVGLFGVRSVTWDGSDKNTNIVLSNGSRSANFPSSSGNPNVQASKGVSSGKFYFEALIAGSPDTNAFVGVSPEGIGNNDAVTAGGHGFLLRQTNAVFVKGVSVGTAASFTAGSVLRFAVDHGAAQAWVGVNATWYPTEPTLGAGFSITSEYLEPITCPRQCTVTIRATGADFSYSPPTGYTELRRA